MISDYGDATIVCLLCRQVRTTSSTGVSLSKRWPAGEKEIRKTSGSRQKIRRTLQQVDIIELQALQALLYRVEDVLPALAILVYVAEAVGVRGAPKALPRLAANREV
jgi:hypothetical protein